MKKPRTVWNNLRIDINIVRFDLSIQVHQLVEIGFRLSETISKSRMCIKEGLVMRERKEEQFNVKRRVRAYFSVSLQKKLTRVFLVKKLVESETFW